MLGPIGAVLEKYILPLKVAAVAVAVAAAWFVGRSGVLADWEADRREQAREIGALEEKVRGLEKTSGVITEVTVKEYVDRVKVIREKIYEQIPVYIPAGTPDLPPGFRVLHDAAATSLRGPVPDASAGADGAAGRAGPAPGALVGVEPVPVRDAAGTVTRNYGACEETAARLKKLQDWVRKQYLANPPAEAEAWLKAEPPAR
jgi:hypothetical protein